MRDFTSLIDSFGLHQSVDAPTHNSSHILGIVLLHGVNIMDQYVYVVPISNHFPVCFDLEAPMMSSPNSETFHPCIEFLPPLFQNF